MHTRAPVRQAWLTLLLLLIGGTCAHDPPASQAPILYTKWTGGPKPIPPSDAVRAAGVLGSCLPYQTPNAALWQLYTRRGSWDIDLFSDIYARDVACLASRRRGCQALHDCLGLDVVRLRGRCLPACDGTILKFCLGQNHYIVDCSRYGMTCATHSAQCAQAIIPKFTEVRWVSRCDDDRPVFSDFSFEFLGPECGPYGLQCEERLPGTGPYGTSLKGHVCRGEGDPCASDHVPYRIDYTEGVSCQGKDYNVCINGSVHNMSCDELGPGLTCQSRMERGRKRVYCGLGDECSWEDKSRCEGDKLVLCNAGRIERISCLELGFASCNPQIGVCVPSMK